VVTIWAILAHVHRQADTFTGYTMSSANWAENYC